MWIPIRQDLPPKPPQNSATVFESGILRAIVRRYTTLLAMALFLPAGFRNYTKYICSIQQFSPKRLSSSKRWQARQLKDHFTREAAVQGLKSRAAFKLLQVLRDPYYPLLFYTLINSH